MAAMPVNYILYSIWTWFLTTALTPLIFIIVVMLIPRIGRMVVRGLSSRMDQQEEEFKTRRALLETFVYIGEIILYFLAAVLLLKYLGVSLAGVAIPATVISAAVGLGAQSIIADFLAGFFILQEKQFGVGDWVSFKGSGVDVEGDVIGITMRATTVRTLNGETVIVPNSAARICINQSNYWARAVAVVPVPLLGSATIQDAIDRSTAAALRALNDPEIRQDIRGELDVHPAVGIEKPTVVGMPWMVNMRFVVQVNPAKQWIVERTIRTYILEEFWEEYGSATTTSGVVLDQLATITPASELSPEQLPGLKIDDDVASNPALSTRRLADYVSKDPAQRVTRTTSHHTTAVESDAASPKERGRADLSAPTNDYASVKNIPTTAETDSTHSTSHTSGQPPFKSNIARALSINGRCRPSTTVLLVLLIIFLTLKGLSLDGSQHDERFRRGILAPSVKTTAPADPTDSPTTPAEPTQETSTTTPATSSTEEKTTTTTSTTNTEDRDKEEANDKNTDSTGTPTDPNSNSDADSRNDTTRGNEPASPAQPPAGGAQQPQAPAPAVNPDQPTPSNQQN